MRYKENPQNIKSQITCYSHGPFYASDIGNDILEVCYYICIGLTWTKAIFIAIHLFCWMTYDYMGTCISSHAMITIENCVLLTQTFYLTIII